VSDGMIEYFRLYQATTVDEYPYPCDVLQFESFEAAHYLHLMLNRSMSNPLFLAPVEGGCKGQGLRVIDVGTGDGSWAVAVAEEFPDSESPMCAGVDGLALTMICRCRVWRGPFSAAEYVCSGKLLPGGRRCTPAVVIRRAVRPGSYTYVGRVLWRRWVAEVV